MQVRRQLPLLPRQRSGSAVNTTNHVGRQFVETGLGKQEIPVSFFVSISPVLWAPLFLLFSFFNFWEKCQREYYHAYSRDERNIDGWQKGCQGKDSRNRAATEEGAFLMIHLCVGN